MRESSRRVLEKKRNRHINANGGGESRRCQFQMSLCMYDIVFKNVCNWNWSWSWSWIEDVNVDIYRIIKEEEYRNVSVEIVKKGYRDVKCCKSKWRVCVIRRGLWTMSRSMCRF